VNMDSWIIVTEDGPVAGMVEAARGLGGSVTAAVAGSRALADAVAAAGTDTVRWFAATDVVPPEAIAVRVADDIAAASPRAVLSLGDPAARVLLAVAGARLGAAVVSSVPRLTAELDTVVITRPAVEGKVVETLEVAGTLAGVFDGEDVEQEMPVAAPVTEVSGADASPSMRIVETTTSAGGSAELLQADRVVGVGLGIRTKDDLAIVDELAAAAHAEIACSLPLSDDMRWYDASHVVGTSSSPISPDLYIAVGISGQPQHMSGVRNAKVVVAINNDPDATIFKKCDYGILGDLYQIVPALTAALKET
jgi:electron transfer flavoprotein alpha subunit